MKAAYILIGLIIGSLATTAILNLTHTPLTPTETKTLTLWRTTKETQTKTATTTILKTTTQTKTETQTTTTTATTTKTLTKTTTQTTTKWATKTQTTTAWKTKTTTKTQTKTITATKTETKTKTETTTEWKTKTVTKIEQVRNFQVLPTPDKAIRLIAHANKSLLVIVEVPAFSINTAYLESMPSPTLEKVFKAILNATRRGADAYVVVIYPTLCNLLNKTTLNWYIKWINKLNQTLPPNHVLATKCKGFMSAILLNGEGALFTAAIDGKYVVMTLPNLTIANTHTTDYNFTFILYSPHIVSALQRYNTWWVAQYKVPRELDQVWPWHACHAPSSG